MSTYSYESEGLNSIVLSSSFTFDFNVDLESSWKIFGFLEKELISEWSTGEGDYYWYRVEGVCGDIKCDTNGVFYPDCKNMKFFVIVPARNTAEVCQLLSSPVYTPPVTAKLSKIEKYSRPVAKESVLDGECNILEQQEFCQIAECLNYCIDEDIISYINFNFIPIEFAKDYESFLPIRIGGNADFSNYKQYQPESSVFSISGSSNFSIKLFKDSIVYLNLESERNYTASSYDFTSVNFLFLRGFSSNISPNRNYESFLNINLGGEVGLSRVNSFLNQIELFSNTEFLVNRNFLSSGSIFIDGLIDTISPNYSYLTKGNFQLVISSNFIDLGEIIFPFSILSDAFDFNIEFKELSYENNLTISNYTVDPPCGCGPIGLSILLTHNINNSLNFSNFFRRNSIQFPDKLYLRYKSKDNSWRSVHHFSGRSNDGFSFDNLTTFFTLQCADDFWKFSFITKIQNQSSSKELLTKLIVDMPSNFICADDNISTDINLFIASKTSQISRGNEIHVVSPPNQIRRGNERTSVTVDGFLNDYLVYYDNLSLFKDSYWINNPIEFNINPIYIEEMPTINLQSIF